MTALGSRLLRRPIDVVLRPSTLVNVKGRATSFRDAALEMVSLVLIFGINLAIYTIPLTLAGFGTAPADVSPPGWFVSVTAILVSDVAGAWEFVYSITQNSVFLLVASGLTLVSYHIGIKLWRSSAGFLRTLRIITYSTGVYLATIFTMTWYLSTASTVAVADDFLIAVQKRFIYLVIDLTGSEVGLPSGRAESVDLSRLTFQGEVGLIVLFLASVYYLYVLYAGARIAHGASRAGATVATIAVAASPAIYVLGSILATQHLDMGVMV